MIDKIKNIARKEWFSYVITGIVCVMIFGLNYGYKIVNPRYVSWLIAEGGDMSQHYLGFNAFRDSSWKLPLGMLDTLVYPNNSSIIFTDSIPIFAIFFKMFSFVLPAQFQYFGLWGVTCFILQGVLSARIIKNFTDSKVVIIIGAAILAFVPAMNNYTFTAIAGQWILLIGLEPLLAYQKYRDNSRIYWVAALIGILSVGVHLYFVPMCGFILAGFCVEDIISNRKIKRAIITIATFLLSVVTGTWLLGGFGSGVEATDAGLTAYSFNLNGFINPLGWSVIFKDLPANDCQGDNVSYLGAGCILLLVISVVLVIIKRSDKRFYYENRALITGMGAVIAFATMFACSPQVTLNDKTLYTLKLPEFIISVWSIFRGCGRIIWAAEYLIIMCTIIVLCKLTKERVCIIICLVALVLQAYDLHEFLQEKKAFYTEVKEYHTDLYTNEFWNAIAADEELKHIVYCSGDGMVSLTDFALNNGMTVNTFYFARNMDEMINESRLKALGSPSIDNVYIFKKYKKLYCKKYDLHYYEANGINEIDGVIVGLAKPLPGFTELGDSYFVERYELDNEEYVDEESGYKTDDGLFISPGGTSAGPGWRIPDGKFSVKVLGEDIPDAVNVFVRADKDEASYKCEVIECNPSEILLVLYSYEELSDLEICIQNNSEESILIKSIEMTYAE